jgi:hypothetical protein
MRRSFRSRLGSLSMVAVSMILAAGCGSSGGGPSAGGGAGSGGGGSAGGGTGGSTSQCHSNADCLNGYFCTAGFEMQRSALSGDPACAQQCQQTCTNPLAPANVIQMCVDLCSMACSGFADGGLDIPDGGLDIPDAGAGGGTGGAATGTCMRITGGAGGVSGTGGVSGAGGSAQQQDIDWSGTWTADVSHLSKCVFGGTATQQAQESYSVTLSMTHTGGDVDAMLDGGFELKGTGDATHATLNGDFPFRNWKGEAGKTNNVNFPNTATIKLTTVSGPNSASGTISGQWDGGGGFTCSTTNGTISLSR